MKSKAAANQEPDFSFSRGVRILSQSFGKRKSLPKVDVSERRFRDFLKANHPSEWADILRKCKVSGFSRDQLEALKGPFEEWNEGRLKDAHIRGGKKRGATRKSI